MRAIISRSQFEASLIYKNTHYIHLFAANRTLYSLDILCYDSCKQKKNHEILAALQYKLLYNISRSENQGKKEYMPQKPSRF